MKKRSRDFTAKDTENAKKEIFRVRDLRTVRKLISEGDIIAQSISNYKQVLIKVV